MARWRFLVVTSALLFVASCTTTGELPGSAPSSKDGSVSSPPSTTATVGQYSRILAPRADQVSAATNEVDDCLYRYDFQSESLDCDQAPLTVRALAQDVKLRLQVAQDPLAEKFIGPPPSQVAREVDAVQKSAADVLRAIRAWTNVDCGFNTTDGCDRKFKRISMTGAAFAIAAQVWE